ncbi:MAG: hypothetical protein WCJ64_15265 [Rhodospirillaceae bacterium]
MTYSSELYIVRYDDEGTTLLMEEGGGWISPDKGRTIFGPTKSIPRPEYGRPKRLVQMGDRWVKSKSGAAFFWAAATLPYGVWVMEDGSEIIFNREYSPIWRKDPAGRVRQMEHEWVRGARKRRYLCRGLGVTDPKTRASMAAILRRWTAEPGFWAVSSALPLPVPAPSVYRPGASP